MGERMTNCQLLKCKAESLSEAELVEVLDYINIWSHCASRPAARSV